MRTKWVIGNWKMNGGLSQNERLVQDLISGWDAQQTDVRFAVCVPFPYLAQVGTWLSESKCVLGAQTASEFENGAYTGEVSVGMLKEFDVQLVLVGHSERRQLFGENDDAIAQKAAAVLNQGLRPVVCVGETLSERQSGQAQEVVVRQLKKVADVIGVSGLSEIILAYEPVWAIGTGLTATPEQAQEVHVWLREEVRRIDSTVAEHISILYGGSVKPSNAAEIFNQKDVDGGLIGGAALAAVDFLAICSAANN